MHGIGMTGIGTVAIIIVETVIDVQIRIAETVDAKMGIAEIVDVEMKIVETA